MNEKETKICRFCLNTCNSNFEVIEEVTKQLLDALLLDINFSTTREIVACKNCSENIRKCFDFKSMCLHTENCISSFIKKGERKKIDLQEIYLSRTLNTDSVPHDSKVCRLCMKPATLGSLSFLHNVQNVVLKEMLKKCLPELDLNVTKETAVCKSCSVSLENYFSLMTTCFEVEETIKVYRKIVETNSEGFLNLSEVLQFTLKNNMIHNDCYNNLKKIKVEENICGEETEDQKINIKSEEFIIKPEQNDLDKFDDYTLPIANHGHDIEANIHSCSVCAYSTEYKAALDQHILNHKNPLTISSSKSEHECVSPTTPHEGDYKPDIKKKITSKTTMYRCNICSHKTKYKYNLRSHILIHKTTSEVPTYKCQKCIYQTKHRAYLNKHMLVHKSLSEVTAYKCATCPYQTKEKRNLKLHMLVHRSPSQMVMYKCDVCTHQTKHKSSLKTHMLIHKSSSELSIYKCPTCVYQTKHKSNFTQHILTHETGFEVTVYKCSKCAYETKDKRYLKTHSLIHKDRSEMIMYDCELCAYQTPKKYRFKGHMLSHQNPSEMTMYNCEMCKYQTVHKSNLKKHMTIHMNPSELETLTCDVCSYQTKHKRYLKKHMQIHKSPSEITFLKCYLCAYKCKQKHSIRAHVLSHKVS